MKKSHVIMVVVGLVAVLCLLSRCHEPAPPPSKSDAVARKSIPTQTSKPGVPQPMQPHPDQVAAANASLMAPINFYGKVIDQHGDLVVDADITFYVLGRSSSPKPTGTRKTDGTGMFSIAGYQGLSLGIEVTKPGCRQLPYSDDKVASGKLFYFGLGHPPQSSTESPIVFTLYKPGIIEPLIKVGERNFRVQRDGTPLDIDMNPGAGSGAHKVTLRCWNKELEPRPPAENRYDWKLEITVNNGGIVERKDIMVFDAPVEGYAANTTIDMPTTVKPVWGDSAERSYFIRFNDGVHARVTFRMHAGGDHFVVWESHLNPKPGSRTLETDPSKK